MAGLIVSINGELLASVSHSGLNILTAQVHGDVLGEELSVIDVHGGLYGHGNASKHLIWLNAHEVRAGDEVEIAFGDVVSTSHEGKTIEELFPEAGDQDFSEQSIVDLVDDLAQRPRARDYFTFELQLPGGGWMRATTAPRDFSYQLSTMWNWKRPDRARVSLTSNSIEKIAKREDGTSHAAFILRPGDKMTFRVGT